MIKQIRIYLLTDDNPAFRDIEIPDEMTLEDLHNAIVNSFGFDGNEMASFYLVDDNFVLIDEIPLLPMDDEREFSMDKVKVDEVLNENNPQLIYTYDFLHMWQFLVQQISTTDADPEALYPRLVYGYGELPESAPDMPYITIKDKSSMDDDENFEEFDNFFDDDNENDYPDDWY